MIAKLLKQKPLANYGNLVLENIPKKSADLVLELSSFQLDYISKIRPHISVITGIAPVHLERMKTLENILDAKSEIVELAGSVVINGDDELLLNQARLWANQKIVYDCSTTSKQAIVFVHYDKNVHNIYVKGKFILSVKAPELLQLSIALSIGVLLALDLDTYPHMRKDLCF